MFKLFDIQSNSTAVVIICWAHCTRTLTTAGENVHTTQCYTQNTDKCPKMRVIEGCNHVWGDGYVQQDSSKPLLMCCQIKYIWAIQEYFCLLWCIYKHKKHYFVNLGLEAWPWTLISKWTRADLVTTGVCWHRSHFIYNDGWMFPVMQSVRTVWCELAVWI